MLLECVGVRERVLYDFLRLECENLKMKIYKINVKRAKWWHQITSFVEKCKT